MHKILAFMPVIKKNTITFDISLWLCGEGKPFEEICTGQQRNSMACVKFPIRTGPTCELWPKPSHTVTKPVPSRWMYMYRVAFYLPWPGVEPGILNFIVRFSNQFDVWSSSSVCFKSVGQLESAAVAWLP